MIYKGTFFIKLNVFLETLIRFRIKNIDLKQIGSYFDMISII